MATISDIQIKIQKKFDQYADAFKVGDIKTMMDVYTPDAILMPPGSTMVKGAQAIEIHEKRNLAILRDMSVTVSEVGDVGDCIYTIIAIKALRGDNSEPLSVKELIVWKKIGDEYYAHRVIWNADCEQTNPWSNVA
ncbi:uncharacterized protein LOC102802446 [Saccoglossus kowalevskii]|uniref:Uncharacterized protein LOC102802446 n=1 Tax=Saccoglossus kowalevskii TaxID=10224 RepID=A0ABM0LW15_SACKO|nr:PREDICTED: uncharacterized protein LOC102802446 [Saccoglossus kowalevskii]